MLRKVSYIFALMLCLALSGAGVSASVPKPELPLLSRVDTTEFGLTDSLAAALQSAFTDTTVAKVRDRGFDASKYKMLRRFTPQDQHEFKVHNFSDKTFYTLHTSAQKLNAPDYPFGLVTGLSYGKWLHEDHALRANLSLGHWYDNFNGEDIHAGELTASYLFNLTSYLSGYNPGRFCEVSVVVGGGYAMSGYKGNWGHALTGHIGANFEMKLSNVVSLTMEPLGKIYSNGMAVSRAGNWRSWLSAFEGTTGLTINIGSPRVKIKSGDWFVSVLGGVQTQNSATVYNKVGIANSLGLNANLSVGRHITDYFALRGSASYSRHKWIKYDVFLLYSHYYSGRLELMLDLVKAFQPNQHHDITFSILMGPEFGYMYKDDFGKEYIATPYVGLTGGAQMKFFLTPGMRAVFEPRFSVVPYMGKSYDKTTLNDFVNYYDGIVNMNIGLEIDL